MEDIDLGSRRLEQLASMSSRVELRATHLETSRIREELRETRMQLDKLLQIANRECPLLSTMALFLYTDYSGFLTATQCLETNSLQNQLQVDFTNSRAAIGRIEANQLLASPLFAHLPTPGKSMNYCPTVRNRRQKRFKLPAPSVDQLQQ